MASTKPLPSPATASGDPAADEERDVHAVYEAIAPHFARTRFKPWPLIERFLATLPPSAVGLDTGAGNGKYLPAAAAAGTWTVALDRSRGLLDIARGQLPDLAECVRGDLCDVPWRSGVFDFVISVAAIHHLSTPDRRAEAVKALLRPLRLSPSPAPPARFFIYVWAYEQGPASRRKMGSLADAGSERVQDVLVPWVLAAKGVKTEKKSDGKARAPRGGKGKPVAQAGEGQAQQTTPDVGQDAAEENPQDKPEEPQVFNRYYHLFVEGELRALVERAAAEEGFVLRESVQAGAQTEAEGPKGQKWLRVMGQGWEADNWWIEGEVGTY